MSAPSHIWPVTVQPITIPTWFLCLSHSKHAKYTFQKRSISLWLWDVLYKDSFLIQMSSEGHVKDRFGISLLLRGPLCSWTSGLHVGSVVKGPSQPSSPPKAPAESQTIPRIHTVKDFWMSTSPVPCSRQDQFRSDCLWSVSKEGIFEAISPTTCCICSLLHIWKSNPGPGSSN